MKTIRLNIDLRYLSWKQENVRDDVVDKFWSLDGQYHRKDGAAIIIRETYREWHEYGNFIRGEERHNENH